MNFDQLIDVLLEKYKKEKYPLLSSFVDLPDNPPYGFLVFPDGKYIVVNSSYEHSFALQSMGSNMQTFFKAGGIRVVKKNDKEYFIDGLMDLSSTRKAISTSKDIATFYEMSTAIAHEEGRGVFLPSFYSNFAKSS